MAYVALFALAMVGPFFWPINNEVVIAGALLTGDFLNRDIILLVSTGSSASFLIWYYLGKSSRNWHPKWKRAVDRIRTMRGQNLLPLWVFLGSAFSIPPATPLALLSGSQHEPIWRFTMCTLAGRIVRVGILVFGTRSLLPIWNASPYHQWIQDLITK